MFEYRITKYDPAFRDSSGSYMRDDWILPSQVGEAFDGVLFTAEEYTRVENAYVTTALAHLREGGIEKLSVDSLENSRHSPLLSNGQVLELDQIGAVVRAMLREEYWCRLESESGFVHIGWDYYMYVGVPQPCAAARALAEHLGLYVEEFDSPYRIRP